MPIQALLRQQCNLGGQGPNPDPSPCSEQRASGPACPEVPYPTPERSPFVVPVAGACLPTNVEPYPNKKLQERWGRPGSLGSTPSRVTARISSPSCHCAQRLLWGQWDQGLMTGMHAAAGVIASSSRLHPH